MTDGDGELPPEQERRYVPFLKCKQGERLALSDLAAATKAAITPAFQVLSGHDDDRLAREIRQVATKWNNWVGAVRRCLG